MAIGSGLAGQVGAKKETTYGTRVVPDQFFEFNSEGFQLEKKYLESRQIRSGRFFQSGSRRIATTRMGSGSIGGEVPTKGFGMFLDLLHGNVVTPVQQAATTAYLQTHNYTGDPTKSATIQVGKPDVSGTVRPFDYLGCMVDSAQFSCGVDEWLSFNLGFQAQDEVTNQSLATASYPTALEGFHFQQCTVTVNSIVQDDATGAIVKSMSLDTSLPRASERFGLRSNALKAKPILNDYTTGTGSLTIEFKDMTQYGLFTGANKVPITIDFTHSSLAGAGVPYRITFKIAQAQFTGTTPAVSGPDILTLECPFTILDDGTNPPLQIEYMSTTSTAL